MSAVIRVRAKTYRALRELAARRNATIAQVVDEAVARSAADEFWDAAYCEDLAMRADQAASAAFDAEVAAWDVALLDGLEDNPWEE